VRQLLKLEGLPPRRRKLVRRIVGLLLFYTVFGFIVLPLIVRPVAARRLARELNRNVTIDSVRINPYSLSCAVRGLLIRDPDGEPFVSWDKVYVNFQLSSFFGRPWVFKEISATNIYLRVQVNPDYRFNFSDLIDKFASATNATAQSKPAKIPAVRIGRIDITGTRASLTDLTSRRPFHRVIGPLKIRLDGFRTDPDNRNPHSFTGSTDAGETFSWSGQFFLDPIRAEGDLSVEHIALNRFAPLYQDLLRFEIQDGVASFRCAYKFVSSPATNIVQFTNTSVTLHSFRLAVPDASDSMVNVPAFGISDASGDLVNRRFDVGSLSVTGAVLNVHRSHDASINVLEAAKPADTATNMPGGIVLLLHAVTNVFAQLLASTNAATGTLHRLTVEDCALALQDEVNSRPVSLRLDQIQVAATNLSNVPGTTLTANASLRWNTNGTVHTDVTASVAPPSADLHLLCRQIELGPLNPYLEPFVYMFITDSKLGLDGQVQLRTTAGQLPSVKFNGGYQLDDFAIQDGAVMEDMVKWKSLRFEGVEANLNPPEVSIARVTLDDALARIIVETNQSINFIAALHPANSNSPTPGETIPAEVQHARSGRNVLTDVKAAMSRTNGAALAGLPKLSIAAIVISNAQVQLADRSLTPNVQFSVQQINGTIADLSSDELRHAEVQVAANVDRAGTVEINGRLNPLHQAATSEVTVTMRDVSLEPGDPYSGKFLGYRLRKGALSLHVGYQLSARQLKGTNLIQIDQLTLGEKVNSPDATSLPIKLGVALLKDRAGKIELDVPVEGNLDDPEFRLGPVIWHTVLNVFTKLVTSPFSALGLLFGEPGEEVNYQEFPPGISALPPAGKDKLDALGKALYDRPGLEVEIEGNVNPAADRDGLRREKLEHQLRELKWSSLRKFQQATLSPQQINLTPAERTRLLAELYRKKIGPTAPAESHPPERGLSAASTDPLIKGAQVLAQPQNVPEERQPSVSATERQLMDAISVDESDLHALAQERAKQVQEYLIQSAKVETERVYLAPDTQDTVQTNGHRVYLHLR
jgi:Domain of Unknown Function (DUF748)